MSIIDRIKNVFKQEDTKSKIPQKRKLSFECLESRELLANTVSIPPGPYNLGEGSAWFSDGGGCGGCCGGCCCFGGPVGCQATNHPTLPDSYKRIPVTVVPDPNNPYWLPVCYGINFEIVPDSNSKGSDLQIYVRYMESGVQKWNSVTYNPSNANCFSIQYRPTMSNIELEVTAENNKTPGPNKNLKINISPGACCTNYCLNVTLPVYETGSSSQASVVVKDDDHWMVKIETDDAIATERLPDVEQDYAWLKFTRYGDIDNFYPIEVRFTVEEIVSLPTDPNWSSITATYSTDYAFETTPLPGDTKKYVKSLNVGPASQQYTKPDGTKYILRTVTVVLPAWNLYDTSTQSNVFHLRVAAVFDWIDEGKLFDPTGGGTPDGDKGEIIPAKILDNIVQNPYSPPPASSCGVWWNGLYTYVLPDWDPVDHGNQTAEIEIRDGAICLIMTDSNNDGVINLDDKKISDIAGLEVQSRQMRVNDDDDNENHIIDKDERPANFDIVQNRSIQAPGQNLILVDNENDLAEAKIYVWIDSLTPKNGVDKIEIDVYTHGPSHLVLWTLANKGKHLHYGTLGIPPGRMEYQRTLDTLTENHTVYSQSIWLEAIGLGSGQVLVTADVLRVDPVTSQMISRIGTKTDSANFEVLQSCWQVIRVGQPTANAISGQGDTIFNLAKEIGMEALEFRNWLTITGQTIRIADGRYISATDLTVGHKLYGGQTFQIPNTMLMAWFGEIGSAGKNYMHWKTNIADMKQLGFDVIEFDNDSYAGFSASSVKTLFKNLIATSSNNKQLHGLYMMGHGTTNTIGSQGTNVYTVGPTWDIAYTGNGSIDSLTQYKFAALIIHACESNNSNARSLVSADGIFNGQTGTYVPIPPPGRIARLWGYRVARVTWNGVVIFEYGGKQRTNYFDE